MSAEVLIDEASDAIRKFEARLHKKHNIMLVMDILSMTMTVTCEPLPSGQTYAAQSNTASVMSSFGVSIDTAVVTTLTNVTPVS